MRRGFTLLEVMVALAILAVSLVVLLQAQSRSILMAQRATSLTIATQLAKAKLLDCKSELTKLGFSATDFDKDGDFSDEGFPDFRFECHAYPFSLPTPNAETLQQGMKAGEKAGIKGDMAAGALAPFFSMLSKTLADSIREMVVFVRWKEGKVDEEIRVTTHLVDTKAVNLLMGLLSSQPALPNLGGQGGGQGGQQK